MAPFQIEENGLRFIAPFSPHEWEQLGKELGKDFRDSMAQAVSYCWIIGDWLVQGEKHGLIGDRGKGRATTRAGRDAKKGLGKGGGQGKYARAVKLTGLTESQLSNFYRTAKAYPIDVRVKGISFTKHSDALVFPKDVRQPFLRQVLHEGWSSKRFREAINKRELPPAVLEGAAKARPTIVPGRATKAKTTNQVVHGIECPHCGMFIDRATIRTIKVKKSA